MIPLQLDKNENSSKKGLTNTYNTSEELHKLIHVRLNFFLNYFRNNLIWVFLTFSAEISIKSISRPHIYSIANTI